MLDLIGDIHGHADALKSLLTKLGYEPENGVYSHPDRKVLFVGDYIDRGPQIPATLKIVRSMVEAGQAIALMGNHEFNALCFHHQKEGGGHLRPHLIKNIVQHYETLRQFKNRQEEYGHYIEWFKSLPLYYETDHFRAVHACWDAESIQVLQDTLVNGRLTDELLAASVDRSEPLYAAIEDCLKGKELSLPNGMTFQDKDGIQRSDIRIKWWENPEGETYRSLSIVADQHLPKAPISDELAQSLRYYGKDEKPVFFGHYWLKGTPSLYRDNICCLDYSIAKGGELVAYRWNGEKRLDARNLVAV